MATAAGGVNAASQAAGEMLALSPAKEVRGAADLRECDFAGRDRYGWGGDAAAGTAGAAGGCGESGGVFGRARCGVGDGPARGIMPRSHHSRVRSLQSFGERASLP